MSRKQHEGKSITKKMKTPYGSDSSMIREVIDDIWVICEDEVGKYKTKKSNIDSNLADPYRFGR